MRNFVQVIGNTLVFIMIFAISLLDASAQFKQRDILKIKGKVLSERKADITVFKKESNNWVMIRSMKSRKKYDIKLSPIEHYYIVFVSNDGIKKALFVEGGNVVNVVMKLDVDFNEWSVKYATLYQNSYTNYYRLKNKHKDNLEIKFLNSNVENFLVKE